MSNTKIPKSNNNGLSVLYMPMRTIRRHLSKETFKDIIIITVLIILTTILAWGIIGFLTSN